MRLEALVPLVAPGVEAVTHSAPARGMARLATPLTVASTSPVAHVAPFQRWKVFSPLAA
jgi:hypothetical protein